nr:MAG TPA: Sigma factor AlgU negative regulatory factor, TRANSCRIPTION.96A [Caudoviricetes sp.]
MKIQLNGIIKDYSAQEVKALQQQGHRFQLSKKLGVYVPVPIQIHENGGTRDTGMDELVRRKATGEKFLRASGQAIYAPVDADQYSAVMRPIWREDKREKRGQHCIYEGKPCCANRSCDGCSHPVYWTISLERAVELNDSALPVHEDVGETVSCRERNRKLYEALGELDPIDHEILIRRAAGESERAIAAAVGFKSKESIRKRMNKFMPGLQAQLKDFM